VPPRSAPQPPPYHGQQYGPQYAHQYAAAPTVQATSVATVDSPDSRALVALGYPLVPLAMLSLFDRKQSAALKRQAYRAIAFNLGLGALWYVLGFMGNIPFPTLSGSSAILQALLVPLFLVGSIYYGIRTWQGEDVRIPILTDWIDERFPNKA
jgi:Na+/proline symporter